MGVPGRIAGKHHADAFATGQSSIQLRRQITVARFRRFQLCQHLRLDRRHFQQRNSEEGWRHQLDQHQQPQQVSKQRLIGLLLYGPRRRCHQRGQAKIAQPKFQQEVDHLLPPSYSSSS